MRKTIKLGLVRESKLPPEKRVPFSPLQVVELQQRYPNIEVTCQPSKDRSFQDEEYRAVGIAVAESLEHCDVMMGIKEVAIDDLLPGKIYIFFSHTIKMQPYNRGLLQEILRKKIRLIDYEALRDLNGNRLVAFGRFAGIVGAYNSLWTYGQKYGTFALPRAYTCFDLNELKRQVRQIKLPPVKIVLTGAGRVARGAMETLDTAGIRKVSPEDFLSAAPDEPIYTRLSSADYHSRKDGGVYNREEFHQHPDRYAGHFLSFAQAADILIAGAYWNPEAPVLFTRSDMQSPDFRLKIIADITCDISGSIPSTKRSSTIIDPVYDYDAATDALMPPFENKDLVSVMAVDNLPCELSRNAAEEFGRDLLDHIVPLFEHPDEEKVLERATVTKDGQLTSHFAYLQPYVDGQ